MEFHFPLHNAIQNGKPPAPDGLSREIYKEFKEILIPEF